ncbi:hypothetical protein WA026_008791 [Henosepilachna vigintioctopunctata]|uniref:Sugar phosphate transporter domain-containing protein n=1 Tax=Henosepilachna vigintioctopunctata TaxID=420089 RepID=A0AAW1V8R3_9CUCU
MFGRRSNLKYKVVENDTTYEDADDFEPGKRSFTSYTFTQTSLFTILLIIVYYIPSIGLTFYQHWLYETIHFPLTTVIIHLVIKFILSLIIRLFLERKQAKKRVIFGWKDYLYSFGPPGISSGIDVGFSNYGLELITISLYTMTKSTTIVFILIFCILLKLEKKSWSLFSIVIMISIGLMLFTYKSTQFNFLGFFLTLVASVCSGIRWTFVQLLMHKQKMGVQNPIDMMYHMQPWMILSVLPFAVAIEGTMVVVNCQLFLSKDYTTFFYVMFKIMAGAFVAFFMEEIFVLGLAILWNGDQLSLVNAVGLFICLCGITSHVVHKIRTIPKRPLEQNFFDISKHQELGGLIENKFGTTDLSSESDDDKSDSEVILDIVKSRDR